jgi:hypothetical protein
MNMRWLCLQKYLKHMFPQKTWALPKGKFIAHWRNYLSLRNFSYSWKLLLRNFICSLGKLIPCSRRHMVTLGEQLKPLAPLRIWLFFYLLIPWGNLCPLLSWEHGSWGTFFFEISCFWTRNLKFLPKDTRFSSILFVNEKENSKKGSNPKPLGYKWGF